MRTEDDPLLFHLGQGGEAENLKTPAVGEDRPWPVHEGMESAGFLDDLAPRPQVKVVGVGQDNREADLLQVGGSQGLYRGLGTHRHKNRRRDLPPPGVEHPAPPPVLFGFIFNSEFEGTSPSPDQNIKLSTWTSLKW